MVLWAAADPYGARVLSRVRDTERLEDVIKGIGRLGIGSEIQIEILRQLLRGRRTTSELVELIYGVKTPSPDFHTCYVKVWRGVRELEARGLVSAPVLGRDKTYRVTKNGLGVLLDISESRTLVYRGTLTRWDIILYASTFLMGGFTLLQPSWVLSLVFVFLLGASSCKIIIRTKELW